MPSASIMHSESTAMGDNIDNIIIEHLKAIHSDLGDLKRDVRDATLHLGSLERQVASLHISIRLIHENMSAGSTDRPMI